MSWNCLSAHLLEAGKGWEIRRDTILKEILCTTCKNPEFTIEKKDKTHIKTCKACGYTRIN